MSNRNSFSKDNYELTFGSVFSNDTVKKEFNEFLKTEFNQQPLLFIMEVEELEKIQDEKKKVEKSLSIVKKFIFENSELEVNISFDKKKELLQLYEEQMKNDSWIIKKTPVETFEPIIAILKQELKYDPFKRFVRTKKCEQLMIQFQKEDSVVVPKILKNFDYTHEHFLTPDIEDTDFEFGLSLLRDNYSWKLIGSNIDNNMNTFVSSENYFPGLKDQFRATAIRYETILPYSIELCMIATKTHKSIYESDPNVKNIIAYDFVSYEDLQKKYKSDIEGKLKKYVPRSQCTFETSLSFPKPLNYRMMKCGTSYHYDEKLKRFLQLTKPFIDKNEEWLTQNTSEIRVNKEGKLRKSKYYPMFAFSVNEFQEIDNNRTLCSQVIIMNIGGWAKKNEKILQLAAHDRAFKMRKSVIDAIKRIPKESTLSNIKEYYQINEKEKNFDGMARMISEFNL
eukprot:gene796-9046_t